jgi:hypothetical protein
MKTSLISLLCLLVLGACNPKQPATHSNDTNPKASISKTAIDIEAIKKTDCITKGHGK